MKPSGGTEPERNMTDEQRAAATRRIKGGIFVARHRETGKYARIDPGALGVRLTDHIVDAACSHDECSLLAILSRTHPCLAEFDAVPVTMDMLDAS